MHKTTLPLLSALALLSLLVGAAQAADTVKLDNTTALNNSGSWSAGVPTASIRAVIDSTLTTSRSAAIGGAVSCEGIMVSNPGGDLTITPTSTSALTIGTGGIDMSGATANLIMSCPVVLGGANTWDVGSGRALAAINVNNGGYLLTIQGAGSVFLTNSSGSTLVGAGGLTKTGAGMLTLNRPNGSFTGDVLVSGGTINAIGGGGFGGVFGAAGTITIQNGATLNNVSGNNGFFGSTERPGNVIIEAGGLLTIGGNANSQIKRLLVLSGGELGGTTSPSLGSWNLFNGVTVNGGTATSVISAEGVTLNQTGGTVFDVGGGATSGIDLDVTGYFRATGTFANSGLTKTGPGVMRLSGASTTYTNDTTINQGILVANNNAALGTGLLNLNGGALSNSVGNTLANIISVNSASTIGVGAGVTLTLSGAITNTSGLTKTGGGTNSLTGAVRGAGGFIVNNGTLSLGGANTYSGGIVVNGAGTELRSAVATTANQKVSFGTGPVTANVGTIVRLRISAPTANGCWYTNALNLNDATLITENGQIDYQGNIALTGANTFRQLVAGQNLTVSGQITGAGSLTKDGDADLILTSANNYNGGTTVSNGTLLVTGSLGAGAVTVKNGGTLGGSGTIGGSVTFETGSAARLTLGSPLTLGGDLTIAGSTDVQVNLTNDVPAGNYTLATYAGSLTGAFNSTPVIVTGSLAANTTASLVTSGGNVVLQVVASGPTSLVWTGDGGANLWNINSAANWLNGGTPSVFNDNDAVIFSSVGSSNPVVNLGTTVTPAYVVVDSSSAYTFTGAGGISGTNAATNSLTKLGSGLLTLACSNSYTADTVIGQGVLVADNLSALGNGRVQFNPGVGATLRLASSLNLNANLTMTTKNGAFVDLGTEGTTLAINSAGNFTCGVVFTNAGKIVKGGSGRMTLIGDSTHTGGITVNSGILRIGNSTDVGTVTSDIAVMPGALLDVVLAPGFALTSGQTLSGGGVVTGAVTVASGAVVRPGLGGVDTTALTFRHALTNAGTLEIALNRTNSPNSAKAVVYGTLALGGTLTVTNVGPAPQPGDRFTLFTLLSAPTGSFGATNLPALGGGLNWWQTVEDTTNVVLLVNQAPSASAIVLGAVSGVSTTLQIIGGKHPPTDPETNVLTVSSVIYTSGNGALVTTDGTNVSYTATNTFSGADSFDYVVSDGRGGSATNTVSVTVSPAGEGFNRLAPPSVIGPGTVVLSYLGIPNYTYALDWATNLTAPVNWMPVVTNTAAPNGALNFTNSSSEPVNFFRTRHVP